MTYQWKQIISLQPHLRNLRRGSIEALKSNIEECKLKVNDLLTERPEEWVKQCLDIYKDAINNASGRVTDEELAELVLQIGDIAYQQCNEQEYEET